MITRETAYDRLVILKGKLARVYDESFLNALDVPAQGQPDFVTDEYLLVVGPEEGLDGIGEVGSKLVYKLYRWEDGVLDFECSNPLKLKSFFITRDKVSAMLSSDPMSLLEDDDDDEDPSPILHS